MTLSIYDRFITDTNSGETIPGAIVTVSKISGGAGPAQLWQDKAGTASQSNPATASPQGRVTFYLTPGTYSIQAEFDGGTITYNDVIISTEDQSAIRDLFIDGVDFTGGVTTELTLSTAPRDIDNTIVTFDNEFIGPHLYSITNQTIAFNSVIPDDITRVYVWYGSYLSSSYNYSQMIKLVDNFATGNITLFSDLVTYTEITDWVDEGGVIYRPKPSALPIAAGPFDAADWVVPQSPSYQFSDVTAMKAFIGWEYFLNKRISAVVNNSTSKKGGANYVITNVDPGHLSTLVGGIWVGANHALPGGFYAKLEGRLTAFKFGAVGDDVQNDTQALQSAAVYITTYGKALDIRGGVFSSEGVSLIGNSWALIGGGRGNGAISQRVGGINPIVAAGDNWVIHSVEVRGNGLGNYGVGGNSVTMTNGDVGILVGASSDAEIKSCTIHGCTNLGIGVRTPTSPSSTRRITIEKNHIFAIGERKTGYLQGGRGGNCIAVGDTANKPEPTIREAIVKNNICQNSHSTLISMGSCDDFQLTGNLLYDSDSNGIQVGTSTRNGIINNNHISDLTGFANADVENRGISVDPSGTVEKQISVTGNFIKSAQLYGIDVRVPGMIVSGNIIINTGDNYQGVTPSGVAGIAVFSGGAVVEGNHIIAGKAGIRIFTNNVNLLPSVITGNRVQSTSETAINFARQAGGTGVHLDICLTSNIVEITSNNASGIVLEGVSGGQVSGNIVRNADGFGILVVASSSGITIDHNTIRDSGSQDLATQPGSSNLRFGLNNTYATSSLLGSYRHLLPAGDATTNIGELSNKINAIYTRLMFVGSGGAFLASGTGSPEGSLTAPAGSLFMRTDGSAGSTLYIKESGTGSFGWVAK